MMDRQTKNRKHLGFTSCKSDIVHFCSWTLSVPQSSQVSSSFALRNDCSHLVLENVRGQTAAHVKWGLLFIFPNRQYFFETKGKLKRTEKQEKV